VSKHRGYHHRLTIRATKTERKHLGERANAAHLSVARYLVEAALTSANPPTPETRAERERLLFQVRKVGVNLNQLARRANAGLPLQCRPAAAIGSTGADPQRCQRRHGPVAGRRVVMAGVYMRFYVGRSGGSAANVRYITRPSATDAERDALLIRNYPEYAREGDGYRELRDNLQEYARQREEDEANQPHRGRGAPRTHYRAVLSFEEHVETEEARDMAGEWIDREFPDSRAVAAVHQDSDHTHVHVHLQARDIDGYKLQLDDEKYRELDSEWAEIYGREFGHERAEEHEAKKEETHAWKAEYARAMSEGRDPPEAPERADRPDTAQEIHEREERDYGRDQMRAGGPRRRAAAGDQTASDGERALDDSAREFHRAAEAADRTDREAGDAVHAAQDFADRLPEPDHGRAARDRSEDLEDRGR